MENAEILNEGMEESVPAEHNEQPETPAIPLLTEQAELGEASLSEEEKVLEIVEELPDYSSLPKEELLKTALKAFREKDVFEALQVFKVIRPVLENIVHEEHTAALQKHIEEGGDKDSFEYKGDDTRERFFNAYKELRQKQSEINAAHEAEKQENLKKKQQILADIKVLTEGEETEGSLRKLKDLQAEWKKIKNVPKEHIEQLWESYRVLVEIFYDRLSIFNELKDLDRSKNLDQKIELIARVSELLNESSIKKAFIGVKKFQEEWRNI